MDKQYELKDFLLQDQQTIPSGTVLGICGSMKPGPGSNARSAARSLLAYSLGTLQQVYPLVKALDLRELPLPYFTGRAPEQIDQANLQKTYRAIQNSSALLFAVPAYWSGVSGVFKNFIDVLCGPIYDLPPPHQTVFYQKPYGLILIGADEAATHFGLSNCIQILNAVGAVEAVEPVCVSNPRNNFDAEALSSSLITLAAGLTQFTLSKRSTNGYASTKL